MANAFVTFLLGALAGLLLAVMLTGGTNPYQTVLLSDPTGDAGYPLAVVNRITGKVAFCLMESGAYLCRNQGAMVHGTPVDFNPFE